jgi:hypothetical protein
MKADWTNCFDPVPRWFSFSIAEGATTHALVAIVATISVSTTFPVTAGVFDGSRNGAGLDRDAFAAKFSEFNQPLCRGVLGTGSAAAASGGGAGSTSVTSGCNWHSIPSIAAITLAGGNTGVNNGTLSYNVAPNGTAQPRSGSIATADSILQVMQSPPNPTAPFGDVPVANGFVNLSHG